MSDAPLISIGVPTYNRPDGLRKTLERITDQSYRNLQIIVSDNYSDLQEVHRVLLEFESKDSRVQIHRQEENIGPVRNFEFVLKKATGHYFIWAADDDEWLGTDFLAKLLKYAPQNILTFPEAVVKNAEGFESHLLECYQRCNSSIDYIETFIQHGWGHPFYGLYNLKLFYEKELTFTFDSDLVYYNEGTFLHKLFLAGPTKYVKEASILFSTGSTKPSVERRIEDYVNYLKRTIVLYENSNFGMHHKSRFVSLVLDTYLSYLRSLLVYLAPSVNDFEETKRLHQKRSVSDKIINRINLAATVLINGK